MTQRNSARAFLTNEYKEVLLLKFHFCFGGKEELLWITPGGGVEEGEDYHAALSRELHEELGLNIEMNEHRCKTVEFSFERPDDEIFVSHEVYYEIQIPKNTPLTLAHMELNEQQTFMDLKWWTLEELKTTKYEFTPREELLNYMEELHKRD